jgi:hypothetical protein
MTPHTTFRTAKAADVPRKPLVGFLRQRAPKKAVRSDETAFAIAYPASPSSPTPTPARVREASHWRKARNAVAAAAASHAMPAKVDRSLRGPAVVVGDAPGANDGADDGLADVAVVANGDASGICEADTSKSKPHERQKRKPPRRRVPQDGQNEASIVMAAATAQS